MYRKILLRTYAVFAALASLVGFAALFTRPFRFKIPVISTAVIPFLDRWSVQVNTIQGPSTVVRGEHWFFFIALGAVITTGLVVAVINSRMKK
ncbi:MAG: hypothetical protein JEZ11_11085 [Desulfobacterales bacterium]|nr:hypothetical protein [Desulfobacterales bacterium]